MTTTTVTDKVVLDASGWLAYRTSDKKADAFAPYLEGNLSILIPTVVLSEVRNTLLFRKGKTEADIFLSEAFRRILVPLDEDLAIQAAKLSLLHKLSMADAMIYATTLHFGAQLLSSDAHFTNLPNVVIV